jgi:hypothetical protein
MASEGTGEAGASYEARYIGQLHQARRFSEGRHNSKGPFLPGRPLLVRGMRAGSSPRRSVIGNCMEGFPGPRRWSASNHWAREALESGPLLLPSRKPPAARGRRTTEENNTKEAAHSTCATRRKQGHGLVAGG